MIFIFIIRNKPQAMNLSKKKCICPITGVLPVRRTVSTELYVPTEKKMSEQICHF